MDTRARSSSTSVVAGQIGDRRPKSPERAKTVTTIGDVAQLFMTIGEDVLNSRIDHAQAAVAIQAYSNAIRTLDLQERWKLNRLPPTTKRKRLR